jgi:hypothetical protein
MAIAQGAAIPYLSPPDAVACRASAGKNRNGIKQVGP